MNPDALGISSTRLERLSSWLHLQVSSERLAGCSVLLARRGERAFLQCRGFAEKETGSPFAEDTIVRIFSMTKPVTTVAAMMLFEQGCFQLDDPVSKFIPSFSNLKVWQGGNAEDVVAATQVMTVRHLMTHTSGLTYGFMQANPVDASYRELNVGFPSDAADLGAWADRVASVPLIAEPGTQWNYSVSTDILGCLVEVWAGCSLADYFDINIFQPLQMRDTGFHVEASNASRFAALYGPATGGTMASVGRSTVPPAEERGGLKLQDPSAGSAYFEPVRLCSGGGGLTSTIGDYGRFCQMLLNRGELEGERLLGRKTVEYMMTNQLPENGDMAAMGQPVWSETTYDGIGFGLGGAVVLDPVKAQTITSAGEYHWGGAASTFFWIDPVEDLYVVFLTQLIPSSTYPIRRELRARIYQALTD